MDCASLTGSHAFAASGGDSIGTPPLVLRDGHILDVSARGGFACLSASYGGDLRYAGGIYEGLPKTKAPWVTSWATGFDGENGVSPSAAVVLGAGSRTVYVSNLEDGISSAGPDDGCGVVNAAALPKGGSRGLYICQSGTDGASPTGLVKGAGGYSVRARFSSSATLRTEARHCGRPWRQNALRPSVGMSHRSCNRR